MMHKRGVTLIELLIASAIFAVVIVSFYSAFYAGTFGSKNIEENISVSASARKIMERLNLDLRCAFAYSADDTKFTGTQNEVTFLTLIDSYRDDEIVQDFALVNYKLTADKLMRLCRKNEQSLSDKSLIIADEMAQNIGELVFTYMYRDAAGGWHEKNSWAGVGDPSEEKNKLPDAIKVKLTIKGKAEYQFQRQIFLVTSNI